MRSIVPPLLVLIGQATALASSSAVDSDTLLLKTALATRVNPSPHIDGRLDDPAWEEAAVIDDLLQVEPENLAPPTERTEVRIVYDDAHLYIAFANFDSEPEKIVRRLVRRDAWEAGFETAADWVGVGIDSKNSKRTGNFLGVNAAGVLLDTYLSNDSEYDNSWDAVWNAAVTVDGEGWYAEFEIPFSIFQFTPAETMSWGLELNRGIQRKQEAQEWPGKPRGTPGVASRYGTLTGLSGIPAPKKLEIVPYTLGGNRLTDQESSSQIAAGLDIRYGLSADATLKLTFNPDFGQVEADPSVLNLTAFETYYEEGRPFFVEGNSFFRDVIQLFHSRRIGKAPDYFSPASGSLVDVPDVTTILGAAKLMGKTPSGINYGVVESVTAEEFGTTETIAANSISRRRFLVEPLTNYWVGRVEVPVINAVSTVGAMVTDVRRRGGESATVAGGDWKLKFLGNRLAAAGQAAASSAGGHTGSAGRLYLEYIDPVWWSAKLYGKWIGDTFELNDLGYQERAGVWRMGSRIELRRQDPWWIFLRNQLEIDMSRNGRNDGLLLGNRIEIEQQNVTRSFAAFGFGAEIQLRAFDDTDTFRDPLAMAIERSAGGGAWVFGQTDRRKPVIVTLAVGTGKSERGGAGSLLMLDAIARPFDYLNITLKGQRGVQKNESQWVGIVGDTAVVYSTASQTTTDIQLRIDWTFSPHLTFQAFFQPFTAKMDYYDFRRHMLPKTFPDLPFAYDGDPDFKMDNGIGTFVLRWEYLPGSTLFAVFNLNDSSYFSGSDRAWSDSRSNAVFLKLTRWFQK